MIICYYLLFLKRKKREDKNKSRREEKKNNGEKNLKLFHSGGYLYDYDILFLLKITTPAITPTPTTAILMII